MKSFTELSSLVDRVAALDAGNGRLTPKSSTFFCEDCHENISTVILLLIQEEQLSGNG